ncbi:MAG: RNA polymerase sigma factor [Armatimonadota bacterium]
MGELSDEELMLLARDGDAEAFCELARRHHQWVERFLYHMTWDREAAEDGAQEVLVRVWLARDRYEPTAAFTTFLFACARNWWRNHRDRGSRRPPVISLQGQVGQEARALLRELIARDDVPEQELLRGYERFRIRRAIDGLPEGQRTVFVLSHFEGLAHAQIAELLGIPVGTVKSRMHHAYLKLRQTLTEED